MIGILLGLAVLAGAAFGPVGIAIVAVFGLTGLQLGWLRPLAAGLIVAFAAVGWARAYGVSGPPVAPSWAATQHAFYVTVSNSPASNGAGQRFVAEARPASRGGSETATVCLTGPVLPRVGRGDQLYLVADVRTAAQVTPSLASFLERSGCAAAMTTYHFELLTPGSGLLARLDRMRERISEQTQRAIPGDAGALISGLAIGDDSALSDSARAAFFATGTSHVTAVSGSNLAILIAAFALAGAAAGWLRTFIWQLATASVIWLYVALIGFGAPAVRAALVATLALLAVRLGRKPDLLTLGVLVAAAQILIQPDQLGLLSFRLSTAATLGLLLALSGPHPTTVRGWIGKAAATSVAANVATAPFLLATVGLPFPILSIGANVAIVTLVDVLFPLSVVISLVAYGSVSGGSALSPPIEGLARLCLWLVGGFADLPGTTLAPGSLPVNAWGLGAVVIALFAAASHECRGGVIRIARRWGAGDAVSTRFAVSVAGAALAGGAFAWALR